MLKHYSILKSQSVNPKSFLNLFVTEEIDFCIDPIVMVMPIQFYSKM